MGNLTLLMMISELALIQSKGCWKPRNNASLEILPNSQQSKGRLATLLKVAFIKTQISLDKPSKLTPKIEQYHFSFNL